MANTTKMPARNLGLDDLRYDVQAHGTVGSIADIGRRRFAGTLILVEGPWQGKMSSSPGRMPSEYMTLHLAAGPRDALQVIVEADREVVVDRRPTTTPNHFGA